MSADPLAGLLGPAARPARRAPLVPAGSHNATRPNGQTTHAFPATDERYLVAVEGERSMTPVVVIRHVPTGSCAYTMSKREAWDMAQRRAQPTKGTASVMRRYAASIVFMDLDGNRKVVQEASR